MRWFVPAVLAFGASLTIAGTASAQPKTKDQKIQSAMAAAPASISAKATIKDWPASEGGQLTVLREGTNGWVCLPDHPGTQGNDPMCLDQPWQVAIDAYVRKTTTAQITQVGIGYMIAPGGGWGSNTDPFATKETPDNEWHQSPPHIMLIFPNPDGLKGLPTDHKNGGPWVMWKGTPYVHVMVPVAAATGAAGQVGAAAPKKP